MMKSVVVTLLICRALAMCCAPCGPILLPPRLRPTSHSKKVDFCQIYRFFLKMAHVIEHHVRYRMHYSLFCLRRFFMVLQRFFLKPLPMKKDVFRIIQFFTDVYEAGGDD
jgi:hypothetical protein